MIVWSVVWMVGRIACRIAVSLTEPLGMDGWSDGRMVGWSDGQMGGWSMDGWSAGGMVGFVNWSGARMVG